MNMIADPREHLVVIGNGMAGMRTVEELLKLENGNRFRITVFGAEPHVNYNRIMLSSVLAGDKAVDDIIINSREWYDENGITLITNDAVTRIDRGDRSVTSASGLTVRYDRLLIATGSKPLAPPIPGLGLPGVCAFRDIADVDKMLAAAKTHKRAVVIGGGLLGLEAAWGLKQRGMSVALVHLMPTLMERQLDAAAGQMLQRDLDRRGIAFFTDGQTEEITGTDRAEGVQLADGRFVPADLVVLAIGIRPNIDLAKAAQLEVNRGIVVTDDMRTSDPAIFSVGECVEHRGNVFGLVAPIWDQARVCAARLAGDEEALFVSRALATSLKITGVDVFSAGALMAVDEADDEITLRDDSRGLYKKIVLREGKLVGAVLYGDVADGQWYLQMMRDKEDISALRERLVFGRAFAEAGSGKAAGPDFSAMPDDTQICGCNGVCKGAIVSAIQQKKLTSLSEVRAHTKASASCGQCTGQVEGLLAFAAGVDADDQTLELATPDERHDHRRPAAVDGDEVLPARMAPRADRDHPRHARARSTNAPQLAERMRRDPHVDDLAERGRHIPPQRREPLLLAEIDLDPAACDLHLRHSPMLEAAILDRSACTERTSYVAGPGRA